MLKKILAVIVFLGMIRIVSAEPLLNRFDILGYTNEFEYMFNFENQSKYNFDQVEEVNEYVKLKLLRLRALA